MSVTVSLAMALYSVALCLGLLMFLINPEVTYCVGFPLHIEAVPPGGGRNLAKFGNIIRFRKSIKFTSLRKVRKL